MPGPEDDKEQRLKTPAGAGERTTPFGTPTPSAETTEFNRSDPALVAIEQRYDLLAEVGHGGMGIVYKARDRETDEIVALKVLKREIASRADLVERFKAELRLARKITHKNVCRTYELLRFADTVVIAMEYVEGESLRAFLGRYGSVPLRRGLEWAGQICSALAEAHAQGIVHRDLKPENIVIERAGQAKVMDFGIARSVEAEATTTGTITGTPAYMSPEQAEGKPTDARSDIYSLGLILYEMFTGRAAFRADTPVTFALKQIHETPPPAREVEPDLPARIDRAIQKCLEKDPRKRFQTVAELEAALSEKAEAKPPMVTGEEAELPVHLAHWQRSDWLLVASAIVGLALFFPFFERTSLAPRSKVHFDHSVLRRIAQEYAQKLGAPVSDKSQFDTSWFIRPYDYLAQEAGARAALELANNPVPLLKWSVGWDNGTRVVVDHRGSLQSFSRDFLPGITVANPSLEQARRLAEKALRDYLNRDPSALRLARSWVGNPNAEFIWWDPTEYYGLGRSYKVRVVGEQIAELDTEYEMPERSHPPDFFLQIVPGAVFIFLLAMLGLLQRRQVDLGAKWRVRLIPVCFVLGAFTGLSAFDAEEPAYRLILTGLFAFASAFLAFFMSVAIERSVNRVAPSKLSNIFRLTDRRFTSPSCGLAILRGTLLGLGLLGVDAFLVWVGTNHLGMWLDSFENIILQSWVFFAGPLPSAYIALYALLQAAVVATPIEFLAPLTARWMRRPAPAVLGGAILAAVTIPGTIAGIAAVQPYGSKLLLLLLECVILVWVFNQFDALTLVWTVFTFSFCVNNYSWLVMLEPTRAAEPWIAFAMFGLFVLAAGAISFKPSLQAAYRRLATAVE